MQRVIDLRSDTVTKPSPGMREAIGRAEVGDDVYGEDPTVNRLQERVAGLLGKEAALFVASGTMANQVAVRAHTEPGNEIIMEQWSHPFNYEAGAIAGISGVQVRTIPGDRGVITAAQVEEAIRPADHHYAPTRLICLENTHNRGGGRVYPLDEMVPIRDLALRKGIALHLDGARLMNASVATGISPATYAQYFDSVSICLSKGLGAPAGSLIAGSTAFIDRCHRFRKMFGGGMRQAGVLAAAGLYALDHNVERLKEDHDNARLLAEGIQDIPWISVNPNEVETNMVFFDVDVAARPMEEFIEGLARFVVLMRPTTPRRVRAVTHLDVSRDDIGRAVEVFHKV